MQNAPLKTPAQLVAHAKANAVKSKDLNAKTTVASGAVVGGPNTPSGLTVPTTGGQTQ